MKSMNDKITCHACIISKITCKPLPKEPREQMQILGEQVYSDVWGLGTSKLTRNYTISLSSMTIQENQLSI